MSCLSCCVGVVSAVGKGDCTVRISDSHLMDIVSGTLSPQKVSWTVKSANARALHTVQVTLYISNVSELI